MTEEINNLGMFCKFCQGKTQDAVSNCSICSTPVCDEHKFSGAVCCIAGDAEAPYQAVLDGLGYSHLNW